MVAFVGGPRERGPELMGLRSARRRCDRTLGERGVYQEQGNELVEGVEALVFRWVPDQTPLCPQKGPEIDGTRD